MDDLEAAIHEVAVSSGFSGVVRVDRDGELSFVRAYGLAHRGWSVASTVNTRFGIASGTKSLTALVVMSLVEDGRLDLATPARSVLGADLPLIDDAVTVEHLLAHRSGIGAGGALRLQQQRFRRPCARMSPLSAWPLATSARKGCGPTSCTCRSAAAGTAGSARQPPTSPRCGPPCTPARSSRSIVPLERAAELVRPRSEVPSESARYGLGFRLHPTSGAVILEGADAGVSFRSVHDEAAGVTCTVLSNTTDGAWPVARRLRELLSG